MRQENVNNIGAGASSVTGYGILIKDHPFIERLTVTFNLVGEN